MFSKHSDASNIFVGKCICFLTPIVILNPWREPRILVFARKRVIQSRTCDKLNAYMSSRLFNLELRHKMGRGGDRQKNRFFLITPGSTNETTLQSSCQFIYQEFSAKRKGT